MRLDPAHHKWALLVVFAGCVALQGIRFAVTRSLVAGDSAWYYATARSLLIDHDLDVADEYRHFANDVSPYTGNKRILVTVQPDSVTGRIPNAHAIGTSLAVLPFMAAVHLFVRGDGYGAPYQIAAGMGSALFAFAGLAMLCALGRKRFGADRALLATLTIWLATPLVYYMTIEPLMSHAVSMFAVTALLVLWMTWRDEPWRLSRWVALGLLGGLAAIVRYQDAVFLAIPLLDALFAEIPARRPRRVALELAAYGAAAAIPVSLQLYAHSYYYGSPWITGYPALADFHWLQPAVLTTLFSLHDGLFVYAPMTLLALVGLYRFTPENSWVGALLVLGLVAQLYITSAWLSPDEGATFGNRVLLDCTPIFALGLMRLLEKPRVALCAGFIALNVVVAALYCARVIRDPYIMPGPSAATTSFTAENAENAEGPWGFAWREYFAVLNVLCGISGDSCDSPRGLRPPRLVRPPRPLGVVPPHGPGRIGVRGG